MLITRSSNRKASNTGSVQAAKAVREAAKNSNIRKPVFDMARKAAQTRQAVSARRKEDGSFDDLINSAIDIAESALAGTDPQESLDAVSNSSPNAQTNADDGYVDAVVQKEARACIEELRFLANWDPTMVNDPRSKAVFDYWADGWVATEIYLYYITEVVFSLFPKIVVGAQLGSKICMFIRGVSFGSTAMFGSTEAQMAAAQKIIAAAEASSNKATQAIIQRELAKGTIKLTDDGANVLTKASASRIGRAFSKFGAKTGGFFVKWGVRLNVIGFILTILDAINETVLTANQGDIDKHIDHLAEMTKMIATKKETRDAVDALVPKAKLNMRQLVTGNPRFVQVLQNVEAKQDIFTLGTALFHKGF